RFVRKGKRRPHNRRCCRQGLASNPVCLDWLQNILHLLRTEIDELDGQFRSDVVSNSTRAANSTRLGKGLQSGRDIDGIPDKVVALQDDVADVDADAEPHLLIGRSIAIFLGDGVLNLDGTLHRIDGAGEVGNETVTRRAEDPTTMKGD